MVLLIAADGTLRYVYQERLDFSALGSVSIRRASYVEPTPSGRWVADLTPVDGPRLGPFAKRSEALAAERLWIEAWLVG